MFEESRKKNILEDVVEAIELIQTQTAHISEANDFLVSPAGMFCLSGVCMQLIFIGENIKTLDNKTDHLYLDNYPDIPWHDIMGLRDIIVHEYHRVDEEEIFNVIRNDLPHLLSTIQQMLTELSTSIEQQ